MKYIIKNCPSFVLMQNAKQTYFDVCGKGKIGTLCKDCTDCLLKRIVKRCKILRNTFDYDRGANYTANEILLMLRIEDCVE